MSDYIITKALSNELAQVSKRIFPNGINRFHKLLAGPILKIDLDAYFFKIERKGDVRYTIQILPVNRQTSYSILTADWALVLHFFTDWLKEVKAEMDADDEWKSNAEDFFKSSQNQEIDSKFSEEEVQVVRECLRKIKSSLEGVGLNESQNEILNKKLDQLNTKATELTKFDWQSLFWGTIANLVVFLAIPPDKAGLLYTLIRSAFQNYIH